MSSKLQAAWMIWTARDRRPKRSTLFLSFLSSYFGRRAPCEQPYLSSFITVLDIGTFTGFSALAWYEGSRHTKAEIVTLEVHPLMVEVAQQMFERYAANDRITCIEGKAAKILGTFTEAFDIIFMDVDKKNGINYMNQILDKKLLAQGGVVFVDNGTPSPTLCLVTVAHTYNYCLDHLLVL